MRSFIVRIARRGANALGGSLLSTSSFNRLMKQRISAVKILADDNRKTMHQGLHGIVFSRDRALQLYSLLMGYCELVENPAPLSVVYRATTPDHDRAYGDVEQLMRFDGLKVKFFREEGDFKKSIMTTLSGISVSNLFFLVDDIVFIRPVNLKLASTIDPTKYILSLRHSPYLRSSYTAGSRQYPPQLRASDLAPELYEFDWFEAGNEWSDPWSVDGQILSTAEVKAITAVSSFRAPNTYEAELKTFNDLCRGRKGICYGESKVLNLPINRVQTECDNVSGNISTSYLLEQWNSGQMLDTSSLMDHCPTAPHEEHALPFKSRPAHVKQSDDLLT